MLIPAFKQAGAQLHTIATSGGISGVIAGEQAGFAAASADVDALLGKEEVNTIAVVTRHNSHASFVTKALAAGKHVFVEKPLALDLEELASVEEAYASASAAEGVPHLMVGFNRRFAPQVHRYPLLFRQRGGELSQGAHRGLRRRPRAAARKL